VGIVLSGGNITSSTLLSVLHGDPVVTVTDFQNHALTSMDYDPRPKHETHEF
jgi:hypothetical protein